MPRDADWQALDRFTESGQSVMPLRGPESATGTDIAKGRSPMETDMHLTRRSLLKWAGAAAWGVAASRAATRTTGIAAQDKPYAGITLRGLTQGGVAYNAALRQFAKEFEEQTGAKVEWDEQPWEQLMPKVQGDLAAGTPTYDIFCNDIEFQYTIYPYLQPINDLIAARGYTMDGFFEPVYRYGEGVAGGQAGVRYGRPHRTVPSNMGRL
jgi:hypothetical protein